MALVVPFLAHFCINFLIVELDFVKYLQLAVKKLTIVIVKSTVKQKNRIKDIFEIGNLRLLFFLPDIVIHSFTRRSRWFSGSFNG